MKIQYLGHSCFRLISEMGNTLICDPYDGKITGYHMPRLSCDVVTVSHRHADHDFSSGTAGDPCVIDSAVSCCADDIAIESFEVYHDGEKGLKRGKNLIFVFSADGIRVAHMGDVGELSEQAADKLCGTDVLLIPVGGNYTVDAAGAKWYVDRIKPSVVIPMHYRIPQSIIDIAPADDFLKLFDEDCVRRLHCETLTLDDKPCGTKTTVILLDKYAD